MDCEWLVLFWTSLKTQGAGGGYRCLNLTRTPLRLQGLCAVPAHKFSEYVPKSPIINKSSHKKGRGIHEKELTLINSRRRLIFETATFGQNTEIYSEVGNMIRDRLDAQLLRPVPRPLQSSQNGKHIR
jgi:hypothetical protein